MTPCPYHLSLVIALLNERASLPELLTQIQEVCERERYHYEVILIDDGSEDGSWDYIAAKNREDKRIKGIRFLRNYGKSAALNEGFKHAQGMVVLTMDADLQDSPAEIPSLYQMVVEEGYDMVSGWKKKRYDNVLTKNIPSKVFNYITRKLTRIPLNDFNCGLKAYRGGVLRYIEVFGEMHRYIPLLVRKAGFTKIGEKSVRHQPRKYGFSKFGWDRFLHGFLDLLTILFLNKFSKRPMHFFGLMGVFCFLIGSLILVYLVVGKFVFLKYEMTQRPIFYGAILLAIIGSQLFLTGFIAELVVRNAAERNHYNIAEKLGDLKGNSEAL